MKSDKTLLESVRDTYDDMRDNYFCKGMFRVCLAAGAITAGVMFYPELTKENQPPLIGEQDLQMYQGMARQEMSATLNKGAELFMYAIPIGMIIAGGLAGYSSIKYFRKD